MTALDFRVARDPEAGQLVRKFSPPVYAMASAAQGNGDVPEVVILYSFTDEKVAIHAVAIR